MSGPTEKDRSFALSLKERIRKHEGVRRFPYRDSLGLTSIGIGRCLDRVPLADDEINYLFVNDYWRALKAAEDLPGFKDLNEARQGVLVEMCFQMGLEGVRGFRKFIAAYQLGDWKLSRTEMKNSRWHKQTPERCETLSDIFYKGEE